MGRAATRRHDNGEHYSTLSERYPNKLTIGKRRLVVGECSSQPSFLALLTIGQFERMYRSSDTILFRNSNNEQAAASIGEGGHVLSELLFSRPVSPWAASAGVAFEFELQLLGLGSRLVY